MPECEGNVDYTVISKSVWIKVRPDLQTNKQIWAWRWLSGQEQVLLLHGSGQWQDIWEEFQWGFSIDGVAKARGLEPEQWLIALITYQ